MVGPRCTYARNMTRGIARCRSRRTHQSRAERRVPERSLARERFRFHRKSGSSPHGGQRGGSRHRELKHQRGKQARHAEQNEGCAPIEIRLSQPPPIAAKRCRSARRARRSPAPMRAGRRGNNPRSPNATAACTRLRRWPRRYEQATSCV